ncbi:hypothetical protein ACKKBF_B17820 [Auxenochlorella protothecoides x Auxenochlorella symbiontica]
MALAMLSVPSAGPYPRRCPVVEPSSSLREPSTINRAPKVPRVKLNTRCAPAAPLHGAGGRRHLDLRALPGGGAGGRGAPPVDGSGGDGESDEEPEGDGGSEKPWAWLISGVALTVGLAWAIKRRLSRPTGVQDLDTDDTRALKRILRDTLAEMVTLRSRLVELEGRAGVGPGGSLSDLAQQPQRGRAVLTGMLTWRHAETWTKRGRAAAGAPGAAEATDSAPAILPGAASGPQLDLELAGKPRGGRDALRLHLRMTTAPEGLGLTKLMYRIGASPNLHVFLAPHGACGEDLAFTLNPVAGQGLTHVLEKGCPLHQSRLGSGVGAALSLPGVWISAGTFLDRQSAGHSAAQHFGQVTAAVGPHLNLAATALLRPGVAEPSRLAVMATCRPLGPQGLMAHAWLQGSADSAPLTAHGGRWGAILAPHPSASASSWALGMRSSGDRGMAPDLAEASWKLAMGEGLSLTPGIILQSSGEASTAIMALKAAWDF